MPKHFTGPRKYCRVYGDLIPQPPTVSYGDLVPYFPKRFSGEGELDDVVTEVCVDESGGRRCRTVRLNGDGLPRGVR